MRIIGFLVCQDDADDDAGCTSAVVSGYGANESRTGSTEGKDGMPKDDDKEEDEEEAEDDEEEEEDDGREEAI